MKASLNCISLIESFEGYSPTMYYDAAGLSTIGFGTLIDENNEQYLMTTTIDRNIAEQLLRKELARTERVLNLALKDCIINQNKYDSLCSFIYDEGTGKFIKSALLRKIRNNPDDPSIKSEYLKWCYSGGKKLQGLVNRRTKEIELYFLQTELK